jgi:hypothetical protein
MATRKRRKAKKSAPSGTAPSSAMNADLLQKNISAKLDPAKQNALERIVLAGMKVMFSPQTHQMMLQELDGPGDIVTKLAEGIAKLMGLLFQQSKGSMPGDLLIPAGGILMAKACEFLNLSGTPVTDDQMGQAMVKMTQIIKTMATPKDGSGQPSPQGATPPASTSASTPPAMPPTNPLNQGAPA